MKSGNHISWTKNYRTVLETIYRRRGVLMDIRKAKEK